MKRYLYFLLILFSILSCDNSIVIDDGDILNKNSNSLNDMYPFNNLQNYESLLCTFFYDSTINPNLIFNQTLNLNHGESIEFNLPMAYHFLIKGAHVEFSITREDVLFYFCRDKTKNYFDLQVNIFRKLSSGYNDGHSPYTPSQRTGIIRLVINR